MTPALIVPPSPPCGAIRPVVPASISHNRDENPCLSTRKRCLSKRCPQPLCRIFTALVIFNVKINNHDFFSCWFERMGVGCHFDSCENRRRAPLWRMPGSPWALSSRGRSRSCTGIRYLSNPNGRGDEGEKTVTALPPEISHLRGSPGSPERRGP